MLELQLYSNKVGLKINSGGQFGSGHNVTVTVTDEKVSFQLSGFILNQGAVGGVN